MRRWVKLWLLVVSLCLAVSAHAQTAVGAIQGQAVNQFGAPAAFSQVRVCPATSTGTPCSTTTPIYADYGLSIPVANPTTTDAYGNYSFYVPAIGYPDLYTVQVTAGAGVTYSYTYNGPAVCAGCVLLSPPGNAQQTINGPISLNGYNLLSVGQITAVSAQFSGMLTAAINNGVVNPTLYSGSDLAQQITTAIATACASSLGPSPAPGCSIKVPPGEYTITSGSIYIPNTGANFSLIMDGAALNFSGPNITYGLVTAPFTNRIFIHGGAFYFASATSAKAGIVLGYGSQGAYIENVGEVGVTGGDGLLNLGTNVGTIFNSTFAQNLIGVHMLGSPGYASNNFKVIANVINENSRQNIVDGDISQYPVGWPMGNGSTWTSAGVSSPNYNNIYEGNDLELAGASSSSITSWYPAVLISLTVGVQMSQNYFEATPYNEIQLGCLTHADATYTHLYGSGTTGANCGTSVGASIRGNYFTTAGGTEIYLFSANGTTIEENSDNPSTTNTCFIGANAAIGSWINNNSYIATNEFCYGGGLNSPAATPEQWSSIVGADTIATDLATKGSAIHMNPIKSGETASGNDYSYRMTYGGPPSPLNPNQPSGNPSCTPAWGFGSFWTDAVSGTVWGCFANNILVPSVSDGNGRWMPISPVNGCLLLGNGISMCAVVTLPTAGTSCSVPGTVDFSPVGIAQCGSGNVWVIH